MYSEKNMIVASSSELDKEEILELSMQWVQATSCQVFVGIPKKYEDAVPIFVHTFPLNGNTGVLYSNLGGEKIGIAGFRSHSKLFNLHNWIARQVKIEYPNNFFWEGKMNNYVQS